jgi:hypothetical protein
MEAKKPSARIVVDHLGREPGMIVLQKGASVVLRVEWLADQPDVNYLWSAYGGVEISGDFPHKKIITATGEGAVVCVLECEHGFTYHLGPVEILAFDTENDGVYE